MSRTPGTMTAADPSPTSRGALAPRIWLPIVTLLIAAVAVLAVLLVLNSGDDGPVTVVCEPGTPGCELRQSVHWHADFALYIRGERYDFNHERFFSTVEVELSENVHIHEPFHDIVPSRWTWTMSWKGSWMCTFSLSSTSTVEKKRSWLKS